MKKLALLSLIFISYKINAQIGINTNTPDTSAALHIVAKPYGQGLLVPRMFQARKSTLTSPARGLFAYDLSSDMFYFNRTNGNNDWFAVNPWLTKADSVTPNVMFTHTVVTNVGIGTQTPNAKLDVNGSITSNSVVTTNSLVVTNSISVNGFPNNSLVPAGLISMWSGSVAPNGWALCDGTNGTPDLRGRFIVSYDNIVGTNNPNSPTTPIIAPNNGTTVNYGAIGNKGGENGHVLIKNELPKHKHTVNTSNTDGGNISVGGSGYGFLSTAGNVVGMSGSNYSADSYDHSHSISGTTGDGTSDSLNNLTHENRPPYYVLAFIMKLP